MEFKSDYQRLKAKYRELTVKYNEVKKNEYFFNARKRR